MSQAIPDQTSADRDDRLASILAGLTDELRQGGSPQLQRAMTQHPELADELRELWGAVMLAEGLAKQSHSGQLAAVQHAPTIERAGGGDSSATHAAPLPREFGDFELLEEAGRGGMGVVYKARQKSLGRMVAVKMILRGELASPVEHARFRAEAEAVARLDHPGIVPV